MFSCAESSLLCGLFCSCREWGLLCSWGQSSRCSGFFYGRARAPGCAGFSSCGTRALEHRLSSGAQAWLLLGMWDPPGPEMEPGSPALAGGFSITEPPGKPIIWLLLIQVDYYFYCFFQIWLLYHLPIMIVLPFLPSSHTAHLFLLFTVICCMVVVVFSLVFFP